MEAAHLRLLNPDAVVESGDPESYAEALIELHNVRATKERLVTENGHLEKALAREVIEHRKTKGKLNKDLRAHKDYAKVQALWDEVWLPAHPRSRESPPEDWLEMALARLKDFDEEDLAKALRAAIDNPPVNGETGVAYDGWNNALRNTGNVRSYLKRANMPKVAPRAARVQPNPAPGPFDAMVLALRREFGHDSVEWERTPDGRIVGVWGPCPLHPAAAQFATLRIKRPLHDTYRADVACGHGCLPSAITDELRRLWRAQEAWRYGEPPASENGVAV